jgi:Bardet-Biedl syndrome 4 protein
MSNVNVMMFFTFTNDRSYPGNVDIMTDLGILFLKLNDTELAYDKLHNVVAVDHGTTESLLALGAILQTKNDVEGALNTYKNIQNIQGEGFELWNNIGMCFYRKNKLIAVIIRWTCRRDNKFEFA